MNYVNKTVDKREPSFPDNSDGKAEFLYGYLMKKRKVVPRRPLFRSTVTVVLFGTNMMDGAQPMFFLAILTISLSLNLHRRFESITVIRKVVILQPLQG